MVEYTNYTKELFKRYGFTESTSVNEYLEWGEDTLDKIPKKSGVYIVVYPYGKHKNMFVPIGSGGHFKGKDPNVSIEDLNIKWVEDTDILYIGKAGGIDKQGKVSSSTLHKRIGSLLSFANNKKSAHWGGRYLWQHVNSKDFRMYWYACKENENAIELEKILLADFENEYGKLPFANLSR